MDQINMMKVVYSYYVDLLFSSRPLIFLDHFDNIEVCVTTTMGAFLVKSYSKEHVLISLKSMHPGKSLGLDGHPTLFYKSFWDLVGDEVSNMVVQFLNYGGMPDRINDTIVVLILKVKKPREMKDLRPISMCNKLQTYLQSSFQQVEGFPSRYHRS